MMAPPTQDDDDDDPGDDDDNMVMFGLHPTQTPKNLNRCFLKNPSFMSLTLSAASLRIRYMYNVLHSSLMILMLMKSNNHFRHISFFFRFLDARPDCSH